MDSTNICEAPFNEYAKDSHILENDSNMVQLFAGPKPTGSVPVI